MSHKYLTKQNETPLHKIVRSFWSEDGLNFFNDVNFSCNQNHPNISLSEDNNNIYVDAGVPGLDDEDIEITMENKTLWIHGQKSEKEDEKKYHYRAKSSYSYQIALPENVDESSDPEASYDKGMLHIVFKKKKNEDPKKINIKRK